MTVLQWLSGVLGRAVDLDRAYGAQCVDLVNDWLIHGCQAPPVRGNAVDIINQSIPGFHWVPNGPTNSPPPGSVVVWRANVPAVGVGAYGHTAVAVAGDASHLLTADQNWNGQPAASLTMHTYTGVAGWHQPVLAKL